MKKYRFRTKRRKIRFFRKAAVLIVVFFIVTFLIDLKVRPIIKTMSLNNGKILAINAINSIVNDEMCNQNIDYSSLVTINTDADGNVKGVFADTVKINALKSSAITRLQSELSNGGNSDFSIRLGTLLGNEFMQGRGPDIPMKITISEYAFADISSSFAEAGINQTLHQMTLNITAHITVFIPGYITSSEIKTNFCIAETVIVGQIPNAYTHVNGDSANPISLINDYGATVK